MVSPWSCLADLLTPSFPPSGLHDPQPRAGGGPPAPRPTGTTYGKGPGGWGDARGGSLTPPYPLSPRSQAFTPPQVTEDAQDQVPEVYKLAVVEVRARLRVVEGGGLHVEVED